jgi:hypothetical protein
VIGGTNHIRKLIALSIIVALLDLVVGCSKSPVTATGEETLNLEEEFGGYTTSAESPAFGDDLLMAEESEEEEFNDPLLGTPDVDSAVKDVNAGYYHLRAIWGKLRYDSSVTDVTDWTGSLTVSRGAEVIRRAIRFERGQDYIVPRYDRKLIEWVSMTTVHNDGIAVDIFVPRPKPVFDTTEVIEVDSTGDTTYVIVVDTTYPELEPVTLAFETGPYSRTFDISELQGMDTIVMLDDSNAVLFQGFCLDRFPCPRGYLAGHWGFDEEGQGRFRGFWMSHRGQINGYLKGHFGQNDEGRHVFFGKWIAHNGRFEGFIRGTYGHLSNDNASVTARRHAPGWFAGEIINANRQMVGVLGGHFRAAPNYRHGFFQGRWKMYCNERDAEPDDNAEGFE